MGKRAKPRAQRPGPVDVSKLIFEADHKNCVPRDHEVRDATTGEINVIRGFWNTALNTWCFSHDERQVGTAPAREPARTNIPLTNRFTSAHARKAAKSTPARSKGKRSSK